jgi:hypothetical protein
LQREVENGPRRNRHQYGHRCRRKKSPPEDSLTLSQNVPSNFQRFYGVPTSALQLTPYGSTPIAYL